jgi:CHASE2 domain-containing sensor protein
MPKLVKALIDIFRNFAKIYLPPLNSLIKRGFVLQSFAMSMAALYSRRFGVRAIITVGAVATAYAGYLFMVNVLAPGMPNASHDVILKARFSSPKPASDIFIVDIDERTLASLSEKHGRWPWSRDVLADGLQRLNDLGARAVLFNVLLSDPDKSNPDADAAMDITAQLNRNVAFPLIRLNPKNDAQSQLKVALIPGVTWKKGSVPETNIAAILPMFASMHERLGVANQKPDDDGIVRKYPLRWEEGSFTLPSMVERTTELASINTSHAPNLVSLNWRNKEGRYNRVSFSDVLLDQLTKEQSQVFKNAIIIISVSAPGLGQTKPTSVLPFEDDGEILATAIDDAVNGTYLRIMPNGATLLINVVTIWALVWLSLMPKPGGVMNKAFVIVQSGLGSITLISASYTNYLIDLSDSMSFGAGVFAVIKLVQSMDDSWSRAHPGFRKVRQPRTDGRFMLLGYLDKHLGALASKGLQNAAEHIVGFSNVVRVDDLFGGESFIKQHCADFKCLLVNVPLEKAQLLDALLAEPQYVVLDVSTYDVASEWDPESSAFAKEVAPIILACGSKILSEARSQAAENPR